jgi:hypothetical protein
MLCVERDENGEIVSVRRDEDGEKTGVKQAIDEEILDFLSENASPDSIFHMLESTDLAVIRVLEDLIDILVTKNVVMFSELPAHARMKLLNRQQMRKRIGDRTLHIGNDDVL